MSINWESKQRRTVDPYETFSSDIVNSLNRVLSSDGRGIINGLDVSIVSNNQLKISKGCFLKDSVFIELTEDFTFSIVNENYVNSENILVFSYKYEKKRDPNKATIKLISKNNYDSEMQVIICIVKINNDNIISISNFSETDANIKREIIKTEFINNILRQTILNTNSIGVEYINSNEIKLNVKDDSHQHSDLTLNNISWNKILNKPNINITLTGDVSGLGVMNEMNSVDIQTTIENNHHTHDNSSITSVDWNKIINMPNIKITLSGNVTGSVETNNLNDIRITVSVDNDSHEHSDQTITSVDWSKIRNVPSWLVG